MAPITELSAEIKINEASVDKATKTIKSKFDEAGNAIQKGMAGKLDKIFAAVGGGVIVAGFNKLAGGILTLADNLQKADIAFTTMLGSADKSKVLLQDLSKFAANTPFELVGVRQNAKQLLAYGIEAEKIIPTLKALGDVSAGLSVPLEQVANAYGQVRVAGKLRGQELLQFFNAGIPIVAELSKNLGVSETAIKKMVETGKIGFADVEKAFQTMSGEGGKFANLMEKQSQTLGGAWSNFKDAVNSLGESIGTVFIPVLTSLTRGISDAVVSFKAWIDANPTLTKALGFLAVGIVGVIAVLSAMSGVIGIATTVAGAFSISIGALLGPLALVLGAITILTVGVAKYIDYSKESELKNYASGKSLWELKKQMEDNKSKQEELNKKVKDGTITQEQYKQKMKELQKEYEKLSGATKYATMSKEEYKAALDRVINTKVNTKAERDELLALTNETRKSAQAFLDLAKAKLIALSATSSAAKAQLESQQTKEGSRSLVGAGSNATLSSAMGLQELGLAIAGDKKQQENLANLDAINKEIGLYEKDLNVIDSKISELEAFKFSDAPTASASGGGGGGGGSGKSKEDALKKAREKREAEIRAEAEKNIRLIEDSDLSEKQKAKSKIQIIDKMNKDIKDIEGKTLENIKDESEKYLALDKERVDTMKNLYVNAYKEADDKVKESGKKLQDYRDEIQKVADKFEDLRKKAIETISDVNNQIGQLNLDAEANLGKRYAQVLQEITRLQNNSNRTPEDQQQLNQLEAEKQFLLNNTTSAIRDQSVAYAALSEAQRIVFDRDKQIAELNEKKAIAQAFADQMKYIDANGSQIEQNLKIDPTTNKAFYENEKGDLIEITNAKNVQYAQDLINQQIKLQGELQLAQQKYADEKRLYDKLVQSKTDLEAEFTKFLQANTELNRSEIRSLIAEINSAISAYQKLQAEKAAAISGAGYYEGGYTGDIPTTSVAGEVHGQEYVVPSRVLKAVPELMPQLEALRNGTYDYSRNQTNNVIVNEKFDINRVFERLKWLQ